MKTVILAAAAALLAAPALAQTAPAPSTSPSSAMEVDMPDLTGATPDPTCGARPALVAQHAFCVASTQAALQDLADRYDAAFTRQGWLAAAGGDNLTVYVKRRAGGGCDGFQMYAFAGPGASPAPAAPAYLAFATVPGDVCAAHSAATPQ